MARTGLTRRLEALEGVSRARATNLDHLSDDELDAYALGLIGKIGDSGVALPEDWRDQYRASPVRFIEWVQQTAKEMLECAG